MPHLTLVATSDHIRRISGDTNPTQAIIELIWNGIDAEANQVSVKLVREHLGAISEIIVTDTGHGITPEEVTAEFGRIGDSWKSRGNRRSKNDVRRVHGSKGMGRLRAFALGPEIGWVSTSEDTAGVRKTIQVDGSSSTRNRFFWTEIEAAESSKIGTTFTAYGQQKAALNSLDTLASQEMIAATFAPTLLDDPSIEITLYGDVLDPSSQIEQDRLYKENVEISKQESIPIQVRIIEWKSGKHRQIYFGDSPGHVTHVESGKDIESVYPYSAYVAWPGLEANSDDIGLGALAPDPVARLIAAAQSVIRKHFRERRRQGRRKQIEIWISQGVYPYQGKPTSEAERIERTLFDVVSGTISGQVPAEQMEAALTLRLLKNVLVSRPGELTVILNDVMQLSVSELAALTTLLRTASLSNIVQAATLVTARQHFLTALDHFIYHPTDSRYVGERRHLHPMLERELWIFGEEYSLMSSERGLTEMLRNHLRLSGLPSLVTESVKTWDDKLGRTDLHLGVARREHDRDRHLIVELKAPSIEISDKEVEQIRKYGNVVLDDPRFHSGSAMWDFILVGGKIDKSVWRQITDHATGEFWSYDGSVEGGPKVSAFIRSWRDIIDENRRRLLFFTAALEQDPSLPESIEFLREQYAELLPERSSSVDEDGSASTDVA